MQSRRCFVLLAAVTLALSSRAALAFHLEDSLRNGSANGHPVGGTFTENGWQVTGRTDVMWFAVPRLVTGYIEFTMTGATVDNLVWEDVEIFAMYEAGYDITEPIRYNPEYRNGHHKALLRIYGTGVPDRYGLQKLIWLMCPGGPPGYDECSCGTQFYTEHYTGDPNWDGSAQRIRIEWSDHDVRYLRNGSEVLYYDWSGTGLTWGPDALHFSLGTSRAAAVGGAGMPIGAVFSDLVVDGVEGQVAVCPGSEVPPDDEPDIGPPDPDPVDLGAPDPPPSDAGTSDDVALPPDTGGEDPVGAPDADAPSVPELPRADSPAEAADSDSSSAAEGGSAAPNGSARLEGGCGCSTTPDSPSAWLVLLGLALWIHRRDGPG